ncbi:hypothetical protein LTS08_001747 [Lithohypha guttulata]|nr:hypothetical protein LTS08_001747 [Lithohypha guttulata]
MARRSARIASSQESQPPSSPPSTSQSSSPATGRKRKAESGTSPVAKRGKQDDKQQTTIEESMDVEKDDAQPSKPQVAEEEPQEPAETKDAPVNNDEAAPAKDEEQIDDKKNDTNGHATHEADTEKTDTQDQAQSEQPKEPQSDEKQPAQQEDKPSTSDGDNAVQPSARDDEVPSSIQEKGIIYFLYRGRVNIESPNSVQDIARSYLLLRPLPHGAKIGDGTIGDEHNCRLIAIPKKMLPVSGRDKWTAFVEKSNTSFKELKDTFMKGDDRQTQAGASHSPAATPAAEGVYAITSTGRDSHLAYILTLPEKLGDVQNDLGLRPQGSFVVSVKNPKAPGPANANIGIDPGYSKDIQSIFGGLRWAPMRSDMLNYEGCQFLMIGEDGGLDSATEAQAGDENKKDAKEELEKLEGEDEVRIEHLKGDDAIFADLGTNAKDYPSLQTTW